MKIPGYALFLVLLAGISIGSVYAAANVLTGDVTINPGAEDGNLYLNGGHIGVGVPPNNVQTIRADSPQGESAIFLVTGNGGDAIFNMRTFGDKESTLQLSDGTDGTTYRVRIAQPSNEFQIVDLSGGVDVKFSVNPSGDVCIGTC